MIVSCVKYLKSVAMTWRALRWMRSSMHVGSYDSTPATVQGHSAKCHFTLGFCMLNFSIAGCPSSKGSRVWYCIALTFITQNSHQQSKTKNKARPWRRGHRPSSRPNSVILKRMYLIQTLLMQTNHSKHYWRQNWYNAVFFMMWMTAAPTSYWMLSFRLQESHCWIAESCAALTTEEQTVYTSSSIQTALTRCKDVQDDRLSGLLDLLVMTEEAKDSLLLTTAEGY